MKFQRRLANGCLSFHASRFEARHKTLQGASNHSFDWHAPYAGRWNRELTAGFGCEICEYRHYSDCRWMDLRICDPELVGCSRWYRIAVSSELWIITCPI